MINIIGKYTRISSTGSLIYRKRAEGNLNIYQQTNNFLKGDTWNDNTVVKLILIHGHSLLRLKNMLPFNKFQ